MVQSEPIWYDLKGSVKKIIELITEASKNNAELVAFPETFIPGYPVHIWENAANTEMNLKYIKNCLSIDSQEFKSICRQARECEINVVLGFAEREQGDQSSIYMSQAIIDKTGTMVLKRRKIKPTHVERALFGDGKACDLSTVRTLAFENGNFNVGCLNCWEHAQPLLTFNAASQNEQIHVGSWPALLPTDSERLDSMSIHGAHALASAYAIQAQTFYLFSNAIVTDNIYECLDKVPRLFNPGGGGCSGIFSPMGALISEELNPQFDGLLYGDIEKDEIVLAKHFLDVVGHYSRSDLFSMTLHPSNEELVTGRKE